MLSPHELLAEFFPRPDDLATVTEVPSTGIPPPYAELLVHGHHMTVTMEAFHHSPVSVEVLAVLEDARIYRRQIILRKTIDRRVVQFGIVRLHADRIDAEILAQIRAQAEPLGRILIRGNVFRSVVLEKTWRVDPKPPLAAIFGLEAYRRRSSCNVALTLRGD